MPNLDPNKKGLSGEPLFQKPTPKDSRATTHLPLHARLAL
jgi:hypothetical protein